jgi:hypothetical protein
VNAILRSTVAGLAFLAMSMAATAGDPARVFPAETLAYADLSDPAAVAPQISAIFKGTPLENGLKFIDGRRDAAKTPHDLFGKEEMALIALLASPEMATEFKRLGGIGIGLTGFTDQCDPEAVLAVLTGDSAAAGLVARAFLTTGTLRKVAEVQGVPVYQYRQPNYTYDPNDGRQKLANDKPPTEGPYEATFAYTPGLFVAGTSKAAVAPVITRFLGKAKGSLAEHPAFQEARTANKDPGVFFFVDVPRFCSQYDGAREKVSGLIEPDAYAWFKMMVSARTMKHLSGLVRLRDGGLAISIAGRFDAAQKSPLFDFLSGPGVSVELLQHSPAPASIALVVALPEKDRAATVINFLDAMAKSSGQLGRLPGEAVKELNEKYKLSVERDLVGKVQSVAIVMPVKQELPKGARARPMVVLFTDDAAAAGAWEDFLPRLVADLSGANTLPQPVAETIGGVRVLSLPGASLPWNAALHYARNEGVLVVGLDRKLVAAAVHPNKKAIAAPAGEPPVLVGTVGLGGVVRLIADSARLSGPVVPVSEVGPATGPRPGSGPAPAANGQKEDEAKRWEELLKSVDAVPPGLIVGRRLENELRIEITQPRLAGGPLPAVIGAAANWFDTLLNRGANPNMYPYPTYRRGIRRGGF